MSTTPKFRYIGITDECVECQKCGRVDLKSTIVLAILDAEGNEEDITYYGSTCAARALGIRGGGRSALQAARAAHEQTLADAQRARRILAFYGLPLTGEPTYEERNEAMQRYTLRHPGLHNEVAETGIGVRARVLAMLDFERSKIAEAELISR